LHGGSKSSEHIEWDHRTQQDRQENAQKVVPNQCNHPVFDSLPRREKARGVAHIAGDVGDLGQLQFERDKGR